MLFDLELNHAIIELCAPTWLPNGDVLEGLANDFRLLVNEIMRLMLAEQLFTFVTAAPVEQPNKVTTPVSGTNNEAERALRNAAQARKTCRTNKTLMGARRQTVLTSVLDSLRLYLPQFTLASVLDEMKRWWSVGRSCFADALEKRKQNVSESPVLDRVIPCPSG